MSEPRLAATAEEFAEVCRRIAAADRVAFDTEFVPEYTYTPELCLVQIATGDTLAAIDTRAGFFRPPPSTVTKLGQKPLTQE